MELFASSGIKSAMALINSQNNSCIRFIKQIHTEGAGVILQSQAFQTERFENHDAIWLATIVLKIYCFKEFVLKEFDQPPEQRLLILKNKQKKKTGCNSILLASNWKL